MPMLCLVFLKIPYHRLVERVNAALLTRAENEAAPQAFTQLECRNAEDVPIISRSLSLFVALVVMNVILRLPFTHV